MKALLVLVILVLVAAATVVAYATGTAAEVEAIGAGTWSEPATLLISGSALIGAAGAVRRLPF